MRILVDMDGVLANCMEHWLKLINRYHGENLTPADIKSWHLENHCERTSKEQVYKFLKQDGFFRHLEPIPGALEGMRKLIQLGHDVVILTACEHGQRDKREWLADHLPQLPKDNLVIATRKDLVCGDVLIDDGVHNLKAWSRIWNFGTPICFGHPWNEEWSGLRYTDWDLLCNDLIYFVAKGHPVS